MALNVSDNHLQCDRHDATDFQADLYTQLPNLIELNMSKSKIHNLHFAFNGLNLNLFVNFFLSYTKCFCSQAHCKKLTFRIAG